MGRERRRGPGKLGQVAAVDGKLADRPRRGADRAALGETFTAVDARTLCGSLASRRGTDLLSQERDHLLGHPPRVFQKRPVAQPLEQLDPG